MENEKKTSRLGVRLSAIVVAVLLVVCMAVPAFATTITVGPFNGNNFESLSLETPEGYPYFVAWPIRTGVNNNIYTWNFYAFSEIPSIEQVYVVSGQYYDYILKSTVPCMAKTYGSDVWTNPSTLSSPSSLSSFKPGVVSNFDLYMQSGDVFYSPPPPPPPDPMESVGSGLTVVIDWVGATVSALFSGELAGLLPLVAIPVAITILIVAIVVIKRSIWGA